MVLVVRSRKQVVLWLKACCSRQETGYVTAEKVSPSPVCLVADFASAVQVERVQAKRSGTKTALKDLLARCVADYNKLCTIKRHRVDSAKRATIYNLLLDVRHRVVVKSA